MSSSTIARMNLLLTSWDKEGENIDIVESKTNEICSGTGCKLSLCSNSEYKYEGECRPGNLCTEFRILKEKAVEPNYDSSTNIRTFEVFKSL